MRGTRVPRLVAGAALLIVAALSTHASAHTQSYGFLNIEVGAAAVEARIELAVRDLDSAFDLDTDGDGRITWGEFRAREGEIGAKVLDRISVGSPGDPCRLTIQPAAIDSRGGETYLVLPFHGVCPTLGDTIAIGYDLLFDVDAQHRGIVAVTTADAVQSLVMTPGAATATLSAGRPETAALFATYVRLGVHHIWMGADHVIFVITLLLGSVVRRDGGAWRPVETLGSALYAIAKVVTAFTLAHSLTLALAALNVVRVAPALTESAIAATIVLAALNNVVPVVTRRIWLVALLFGLVHGFGFANVLADLELPRRSLVTALFAFNVGVELGQLAIVMAALPLLVLAARQPTYGRLALPAASLVIVAIGALWFLQRAFGLTIIPG